MTNLTLHRYTCTNQGYTEDLGDGVSLTLMLIPAGEFLMGAPDGEERSGDGEHLHHKVQLSPFLMGRYPVTQAQWRVVAGFDRIERDLKPIPSLFEGDNRPVERVTWYDAVEFCQRLSARTGKNYHLPSESQWEYACRAETDTAYHFGDIITKELANYSRSKGTSEVGSYPPNRWGLYDMHGNVLEWCQDYWHDNYDGAPDDGSDWIEGGDLAWRVLRGGSWHDLPEGCRSTVRYRYEPGYDYYFLGFRVVCSPPRTL